MSDPAFVIDLQTYLQSHPIIQRALAMFFTQISMSARAQWYDVPDEIRPITARGWFLGRFLCKGGSPLFLQLKNNYLKYPLLASARDFLNNDLFRWLRNGFGHWAFDWEVVDRESYVIAYDWENGTPTAKLHQKEADAFHIIAFALIEILDSVVVSQRDK